MSKFKKVSLLSFVCVLFILVGIFAGCTSDKEIFKYEEREGFGYVVRSANTDISGDITLPSTYKGTIVYSVGYGGFKGCKNIQSITISEGIRLIEFYAFENCSAKVINIPISITHIGTDSFKNTSVQTINYAGTTDQWKEIEFGDKSNGILTVYHIPSTIHIMCSDGEYTE